MTSTLIPLQAAFQAARYARMGHADLFKRTFTVHRDTATRACALVMREGQSRLSDHELPADWQRDDAERILEQLLRDLRDGVLMIVCPSGPQRTQIAEDGIQLHRARLDLLLAALDHGSSGAALDFQTQPYALSCHQLALRLRSGDLVVIKTN